MSTEVKIWIGIGIIVVVVGVIFIFNHQPDNRVTLPPPSETPTAPGGQTSESAPPTVPPEPPVTEPAPVAPLTPAVSNGLPNTVPPATIVPPPNPAVPPVNPGVVIPPASQEPRFHVVKTGESLQKISILYYGESRHFAVIQQANKDLVKDPNKLQAGWKLRIPYPSEITR